MEVVKNSIKIINVVNVCTLLQKWYLTLLSILIAYLQLLIIIPTNLKYAVKLFIIVIVCTNFLEFYMYTIKKTLIC